MMSDVPLETCWAFNKLWNNKFYYKSASYWYFYWVMLRNKLCINLVLLFTTITYLCLNFPPLLTPCQVYCHKNVWETKGKTASINADTRWKRVVRLTLRFPISKGRTQNRNLVKPHRPQFLSGKEKNACFWREWSISLNYDYLSQTQLQAVLFL